MSFVKKLKNILFEEEEYTEPIKITNEMKEDDDKSISFENIKIEESDAPLKETPLNMGSREASVGIKDFTPKSEMTRSERTFEFPDFDEEEFKSSMNRIKQNTNVLDYERKKAPEKREVNRYERSDGRDKDYGEKKKFKPSPIISPVYGILNQDYKAEDIVKRGEGAPNISIEAVRKKAFETPKEVIKEKEISTQIDEPVVTFFEEKDNSYEEEKEDKNYKTIDELLASSSNEINLEDSLELPKTNNLDAIEEELTKIEQEEKTTKKDDNLEDELDATLDSDIFELIDSMYDEREEG